MTEYILNRHKQILFKRIHSRQILSVLLVCMMLLELLTPIATAAKENWNGNGGTVSGGSSVTGSFSIPKAADNVYGYRFSVYDGSGQKVGVSADVFFEDYKKNGFTTGATTVNIVSDKRSHPELYDNYIDFIGDDEKPFTSDDGDFVSLGSFDSISFKEADLSSGQYDDLRIFFNSNMDKVPENMGNWLIGGNSFAILSYCGIEDPKEYNLADNNYIVCEPLLLAELEGAYYAMTIADFAVYQSARYGWTWEEGGMPNHGASNRYSVIMRHMSAIYGLHLYAEAEPTYKDENGNQFNVFNTVGVNEDDTSVFRNDEDGYFSILFHYVDDKNVNNEGTRKFNCAADILKHQIGMGIYSKTLSSFTLTIDPNEGFYKHSSEITTIPMLESATEVIPNPVRPGYTFVEWEVSNDSCKLDGNVYTQGDGDCTLTAVWEKADTNYVINHWQQKPDGTAGAYNSSNYTLVLTEDDKEGLTGSTITLANLQKNFAHFSYDLGQVGGTTVTTTKVLADGTLVIDLYYNRNAYTIELDKKGGTGGVDKVYELYGSKFYTDATDKTTVTSIAVPTRTGYIFGGYYTAAGGTGTQVIDASGKIVVESDFFTKNSTIYAQWMAAGVSYQVNHYLMNMDGITYTMDISQTLMATTGEILTLADLKKTYTGFTYGYGQVGGSTVTTTTVLADGSRVINLYYLRNQYKVTLDKGDGISSVTGGGTYFYGEEITINAEVAANYKWLSWTQADGGALVSSTKELTITVTDTIHYTANAESNDYTIRYDGHGATSGTMPEQSVLWGTNWTLAINGFTRPGYVFVGWNSKDDYSGVSFANKETVKNLPTLIGMGDANGDGAVTADDSSLLYDYWAGHIAEDALDLSVCDLDADGLITLADLLTLHQLITTGTADTTVVLYAQWEKLEVSYKVNHYLMDADGNGYTLDAGFTQTIIGTSGEKITLAKLQKPYDGFVFSHGQVDGETVTTATVLADGSLVIDLYYNRNQYTIELDKQDGAGGADKVYELYGSKFYIDTSTMASVAMISRPSKAGYTFAGYFTEPEGVGTRVVDASGIIVVNPDFFASDETVYANWTPNTYTITLDKQDGTGGTDKFYEIYGVKFYTDTESMSAITYVDTPTKDGYTFDGYYTEVNGGGERVVDENGIIWNNNDYFTKNTTLYAKWLGEGTSYKVNHYLEDLRQGNYTLKNTQELSGIAGTEITPAVYSYSGFTSPATKTVTIAADGSTVVNYFYTRNSYKLTVNAGTGISSVSGSGTYLYGETVTINATVDTGHTWDKWSGSILTDVKELTFNMPAEDATADANAIAHTYTIQYDGNGHTGGSTADSKHTYGVFKTLTANGYIKDGYIFKGWNTREDGTGRAFDNGESVKNLTDNDGEVITLYAVWGIGEDDGPIISAENRWFTLDEAKDGAITLEELMSTAKAVDGENGVVTDFAAGEGTFTIINYHIDDFTAFTGSGSVTITYYAEDLSGNVAYKTVTIYITDLSNVDDAESEVIGVRFISKDYYRDDTGAFVEFGVGGLNPTSIWIANSEYVDVLTSVMNNTKGSGGWSDTPAYSFIFKRERIEDMQAFVDANGIGTKPALFFSMFLSG